MKENKILMGYKLGYDANLPEGSKKFLNGRKYFKTFSSFFCFLRKTLCFSSYKIDFFLQI